MGHGWYGVGEIYWQKGLEFRFFSYFFILFCSAVHRKMENVCMNPHKCDIQFTSSIQKLKLFIRVVSHHISI
jgi:hypothetical protein